MSVINLHYNLIFIHVPKTAGTSMRTREFLGGSGHKTAFQIRQMIQNELRGADFNAMFKFAFVRNPYDRYVSAVCRHHLDGRDYTKDVAGFEKFTIDHETKLRKLQLPNWQQLIPQHVYICYSGKILVDFVGKYETLKEDWNTVCWMVGVHDWLPHGNRSVHGPWRDYYRDKRVAEIVFGVYRKDFEFFYPEFLDGVV